jgi:chlorobactene glucosyltransferase
VPDLAILFLVAYGIAILSLIWNLVRTMTLIRHQRALPSVPTASIDWPLLDILVPVKDEAATIGKCLHSVIAQDYPRRRIMVVNDRSKDNTAGAVQLIQDEHPEVSRFDIAELPAGLYGKPHALHTLAPQLQGQVIAFVDSDLYLQPHCLRTLIYQMQAENLDWVAVAGKPEISRFWETLLVPVLGAVSFAWYDPRKISDPKWPNAIGSALMVCRRDAYEAIGGHGCVIRAYDEDSEIIRIAKRAGQRVSFLLTPELFTQRHYGTLASTIRGVTRTFIGGLKTLPRMLITINALNFISLIPIGVMLIATIASVIGHPLPHTPLWIALAAIHFIVSTILSLTVYRTAGTSPRYAFMHPLASAMMIVICIRAAVHLVRGTPITWRGTTY